jgi:hypothetical protein
MVYLAARPSSRVVSSSRVTAHQERATQASDLERDLQGHPIRMQPQARAPQSESVTDRARGEALRLQLPDPFPGVGGADDRAEREFSGAVRAAERHAVRRFSRATGRAATASLIDRAGAMRCGRPEVVDRATPPGNEGTTARSGETRASAFTMAPSAGCRTPPGRLDTRKTLEVVGG